MSASTQPTRASPSRAHLSSQSAGVLSLVVGMIALALKFWCYSLTNSQVVLSDALESIANVISAGFAVLVLRYAASPPDEKHPYGHGKGEFFSAAFEGGLISFAALLITLDSIRVLVVGHTVQEVEFGLLVVALAGAINLLLGLYILRVGRRNHSVALEASGHHLISDVWTTGAALVGLFAVKLTEIFWLDAIFGILAGVYLGWTGLKILRGSIGGLLDEHNREVLSYLALSFDRVKFPGIIGVHGSRIMRSGSYHYIDAHVIVPEFWDVLYAHDRVNEFERKAINQYPYSGEIHFHIDPCRQLYCNRCDLSDCPIRKASFEKKIVQSLAEIMSDSSSRD